MDDIRKDPTEKKSLISDIQKYHQLVNATNIKAYMNKYLKSLPKSPNLEHPLSSKPKKPQSFDSNCTNSHPLKSLLHRASQVNQVNDSNHNSQLMQYEPQLSLQYSFRTRQGQVINNPQKVNQDAFITIPKFLDNNNQHLFAVCDGHGTYGHLVSAFIKSQLPVYLANELQKTTDIKHALTKSFHNCSNALSNTEINTTLSGSTITLSLLFHNKIFTANCGDSRAIISRHSPNDNYSSQSNYSVIELSKDHKPEQPKELARILRMGGRVEPIVDWEGGGGYLGPNRVWLQGQNFPGLAMSRSFGDSIASSVGVSPIPEITEINLEPDMKFIVIATDGIWEYIDNEECINIVGKFFDRNDLEGACDCLLNEAYKRWTYEEDTVVDDITVVVIFLKYL